MIADSGIPPRIFIVDDHPVVRQGVTLLLKQEGFVICGDSDNPITALSEITLSTPDLVLVDLSLGDESGLPLIRKLGALSSAIPVLVYSMHEDTFRISQAFAAGASGYVTKREFPAVLTTAINMVLSGKRYASPRVAGILDDIPAEASTPVALSPQELQVFRLIGEGYSTAAIASSLGVSHRTVDSYYRRIIFKLDFDGMEELRLKAAAYHHSD